MITVETSIDHDSASENLKFDNQNTDAIKNSFQCVWKDPPDCSFLEGLEKVTYSIQ